VVFFSSTGCVRRTGPTDSQQLLPDADRQSHLRSCARFRVVMAGDRIFCSDCMLQLDDGGFFELGLKRNENQAATR